MALFPLIPNVGHPVAFHSQWPAQIAERLAIHPHLTEVVPASRLELRPAPEMVSCGIREIDALTGGLPRGCLTEICGGASSGRTSLLLATLAAATQRQEACALVDVCDAFDPVSAASAGVQFERVLWVRCDRRKLSSHRDTEKIKNFDRQQNETQAEQALCVTDLLLQSGGFGLIIIDLGDVPIKIARRIPLTSWFRFQRAVERTPTMLFVVSQAPCTQSCAAMLLKMKASPKRLSALSFQLSAKSPSHAQLLDGLHIEGELLRSRIQRKPSQSVMVFETASRTG
jgi:recombination protein RecA